MNGTILKEESGDRGFGYDPVFLPDGYSDSFALMSAELKNEISHRGIFSPAGYDRIHSSLALSEDVEGPSPVRFILFQSNSVFHASLLIQEGP